MTEDYVQVYDVATTRVVTISRPGRKNALGRQVSDQLTDRLRDADAHASVRSIVITGAGGIFSAGADIKEFPADAAAMSAHIRESIEFLTAPERVRKPVLAAVDGAAIGGGFELAMCCDAIIASTTAQFGLPEPRLGLTPGVAIQRLPYLIGVAPARQIVLFGRTLDAPSALALGLVQQVAEPELLIQAAVDYAGAVAELAPLALDVAKSGINSIFSDPGALLSLRGNGFLVGSADAVEGRAAFDERRPAVFRGR